MRTTAADPVKGADAESSRGALGESSFCGATMRRRLGETSRPFYEE
jgi:hypothetical protein